MSEEESQRWCRRRGPARVQGVPQEPHARRRLPAGGLLGAAALAGALLVGSPGIASAQSSGSPLVTDRPDATESATSVQPGRFQLEAGYTATRASSLTLHTLGEALLRIGLAEAIELRLGLNSYRVEAGDGPDPKGMEDASLGTKVVLRDRAEGALPRIAVLADATLPTGSQDFGSDGVQPGGILALAWDLSPEVGLGANAGYRYAEDGRGRFDELRTSAALGVALSESVGAFVEYFADHRPGTDRLSEVSADGGVTLLLTPDLQLDARAGVGLDGAAPDYFLGAGVALRR